MRQLKRTVKIGNITIGGTNPIAVQTMLNVPVKDIAGNVEQAKRVAKAGCQIVRVTVPTPADAAVVSAIKEAVDIPCLYRGDRTGQVFLSGRTVSHHYHIVQHGGRQET